MLRCYRMSLRGNLLTLITGAVHERSARGIAAAVSRLVTAGRLPGGTRLPTVRDVARELGVSPTTVSEAWQSLLRAGAIQTRVRSGTFVAARPRQRLRYAQMGGPALDNAAPGAWSSGPRGGPGWMDLSTGVPDHDLLPELADALRRIGAHRRSLSGPTSYLDAPVLPALEDALRARLPLRPEQITVVDGALDALDRITAAVVRFGDHVLVEDPAFPPMLDLLEATGAEVIGVPLDRAGLGTGGLPDLLDEFRPVALYLQPRAHNPTGVSMTHERAAALSRILADHPDLVVIEDDHAGDIASAPAVSLGAFRPSQVVHVSSFSKSHGPDLRLAAVAGPASLVSAVADRRLLGPGWSSRLLQAVLLDLLEDPAAIATVDAARAEYARRRECLRTALARQGVTAGAADGINLWFPVADQQYAMVTLAAHGVAVAPGAPFRVTPGGGEHVRVTAGLVRDGFDDLASILASAAGSAQRGSGSRTHAHPRGWR
jgi:DNA-binding transcriptional MocR family regulator